MAASKAIVTASDSGIGKATAVRLARDGFDVGVTWHSDREGAEGTAREVGGLDVFVNNAGGGPHHDFLDFPLEAWQQVIDLNLTGAFACAQRAARLMVDAGHGGRIVNVTSVHEHVPLRGAAAYCAGKGGLGLLTKVMALELGEHGIAVNAVAPGEIATPMTGAEDQDPASRERPALPAGRPGHADEIAATIAFLASPEARYATGASFVVDGGLMLTAAEYNRVTAS